MECLKLSTALQQRLASGLTKQRNYPIVWIIITFRLSLWLPLVPSPLLWLFYEPSFIKFPGTFSQQRKDWISILYCSPPKVQNNPDLHLSCVVLYPTGLCSHRTPRLWKFSIHYAVQCQSIFRHFLYNYLPDKAASTRWLCLCYSQTSIHFFFQVHCFMYLFSLFFSLSLPLSRSLALSLSLLPSLPFHC